MKYKLVIGAVIVALGIAAAIYFPLHGRHSVFMANAKQPDPPASLSADVVTVSAGKTHSTHPSRQPISKGEADYAALYAKAVPMQTVINADYGWRIRHGYSLGLYANYDDATIEKMVKNGDPLAQSVWFMRLNKGQSLMPPTSDRAELIKIFKRNYQLAKSAILNGVTNPNLVASYVFEDTRFMHLEPQEKESSSELSSNMHKSQIRWAATAIFSEMRGDPSISRGHNTDVMDTYRAGLRVLLNPHIGTQIGPNACKLARADYDRAQAERIAQGKGAFDNAPPQYTIGNREPFPAASICQNEWPGPAPQCAQTWIQSPALAGGLPMVMPGWECSSGGN